MAIVGLKNKPVKVKIGTEEIDGTTNDNGVFTGSKTMSTVGTFSSNAIFAGDEDYNGITSDSVDVVVKYRTTLSVSGNTDIETTDTNTYDIYLKHGGSSDTSLEALNGKKVDVYVDGTKVKEVSTSEGGHASVTFDGTVLTAGNHTIQIKFSEDTENWECESNTLQINVAKGSTSLEFTVDKTKMYVGDDLTYTATLKGEEKQTSN